MVGLEFSNTHFAKVMDYPDEMFVFDFTEGYDPEFIRSKEWGIGRYNEKRSEMYVAPQYQSRRDIHMGIDIWTKAGADVYSFYEGEVAYIRYNDQPGDYGPTFVVEYSIEETTLFALYGHLSKESLEKVSVGESISTGEQIAELGSEEVNGGWVPHLHLQLSLEDPGEADMPGVVAEENLEEALSAYPDPRTVLGPLY
ncbi:peptidoglycan DD-metalloendopeptidase family protein [Aliifodinibius salicampi]|uniref:Peptidoglycan DD-metalloendopeptidase family protein n=1 Tax=Fodinibius salicampi TaxID=1920655 RepID=A0ABT3Q329_9BACT|nr:peptidoglycan DD-metalloendopeptidase family protein [Fodinibius salicampi]MCW9714503.1 peptidoglycan DD-metalloendopeptidase family protein [Fodinibius salicampi]